MAIEAKPYREGKGWAIRLRYKGNDIYLSGCKTAGEATSRAGKEAAHIDQHGQPAWGGPKGKTVGLALQRHAAQTLRFKKGGDQEARRINRYLRHAGLDEIVLAKLPGTEVHEEEVTDTARPKGRDSTQKKTERVYFKQEWRRAKTDRDIPNSLRQHRQLLTVKTADSDRIRAQIARTQFTKVTTDLLQSFVAALVDEGTAPATVYQEIAILRQLFNHARRRWKWREPEANPASDLELPTIDNERDRVMSVEEQERLLEALANRRAKGVVELVTLAVESAMRAEELVGLTWDEVQTENMVIKLNDAKTGARAVPLSPTAIEVLLAIPRKEGSERVFPGMTYDKLASAWRLSCVEAGITGLRFHDVRATAATRFAAGPGGRNIFLVKVLTGHKTLVMVERYVRIGAPDVAKLMHEAQAAGQRPQVQAPVFAGVDAPVTDVPAVRATSPMPEPPPLPKRDSVAPTAGTHRVRDEEAPATVAVNGAEPARGEAEPSDGNIVQVDFKARRRA